MCYGTNVADQAKGAQKRKHPQRRQKRSRGMLGSTIALMINLLITGCGVSTTERLDLPPLQTVSSVDLPRYMGKWYEIASYPQHFQAGCAGTSATYSLRDDGMVSVVNRCFDGSLQGEERSAEGRARSVDASDAKLEVSFFGPFWGDYWIIELDSAYQYAVVASPGRDYLWILSRTTQMNSTTWDMLMQRLVDEHQFDLKRLQRTDQPATAASD